ncbi:hypothetical protein [Acaryochloris marina]|uniref:hypothetical protein n=1 Tax=Acaryochloris marina TaxID=155978 RepID=UPI0021C2D05F|nr:hypothetical protein [Acaryochloris marina]BDM82884.1 hypothetical protein AM10699_57450 [Acaryochloris marina MBIC10699]
MPEWLLDLPQYQSEWETLEQGSMAKPFNTQPPQKDVATIDSFDTSHYSIAFQPLQYFYFLLR